MELITTNALPVARICNADLQSAVPHISNLQPLEIPASARRLPLKACFASILAIVSLAVLHCSAGEATGFSFQSLTERARALAAKDFHAETSPELPDFLKKIGYDQYQDIQFRAGQSPWYHQQLPFDIQFFHRGYLFVDPVKIHLIEATKVRDVSFSADQFNYGKNQFPKPIPPDLDFAGFRVLYSLTTGQKRAEIASFVGASYFRLVGNGERFGASSRGLAIDTAEPNGEEFPRFIEFWLGTPGETAADLKFYALLESASAAGAFQFVLKPGRGTTIDVEANLFPRKNGKKFGFAPLGSMFLVGENRTHFVPDFRPEIHDSDGLLLQSGGDWIWRPLVNPEKKHHISKFPVETLGGFGLLQRDHNFDDYEDLGARYDLRPSLWVKPKGQWPSGTVELVEIPSTTEYNDNIVAYWTPKERLSPGQPYHWTYTLSTAQPQDSGAPGLVVQSTRITPEHDKAPPRFVIDFVAQHNLQLPGRAQPEAKVQISRGELRNLVTQTNEVTGGWRVFFDLTGAGTESVDLRLVLQDGSQPISETWVYYFQNP